MNGINSKDRFSFAKGYRARTIFLIFDILLLGILMCMMVLPLLKVIVDSIDPTSYGVRLWPRKIDFSAYEMILTTSSLYRPFLVSVLTTVVGTVTGLFIITMGAYVLIQKDMPGHVLMGRMVLFTMMFSGGMIPTYLVVKDLHMINSIWAVIIPNCLSIYNMIIARTFFNTEIPQEIYEAAEIDGAGDFTTLFKIVLPLSKAVLAVLVLFYAIGIWNMYFDAILYLNSYDKYPLQVILRDIMSDAQTQANMVQATGKMSSSAVLAMTESLKYTTILCASIPMLAIYPFVQKYFAKGVMIGSVKG